jgi:hypothetical protein
LQGPGGGREEAPTEEGVEATAMDREELIRIHDRILKIRALHAFEAEDLSIPDLEREFALEAIDLMRRQPAMADLVGEPAASR